jgi:hypothetical protein
MRRTFLFKIMRTKKLVITFTALILLAQAAYAQDVITKRNGDIIPAKIAEVSTEYVKYRKSENPSGPIYTVAASEIFMIKYENTGKDVFEQSSVTGQIQIRHIAAENNAPVRQPVPASPQPVPTAPQPVSVTAQPVPVTTQPVPATPQPVPVTAQPVPATPQPVPATPPQPVPVTAQPVPTVSQPDPVMAQPVPEPESVTGTENIPVPQIKRTDNGIFEILGFDGNSIDIRAMAATNLFMVSLNYGDRKVKANGIGNMKGDIRFSSGATAREGSSLMLGNDVLQLPKNTEAKCRFPDLPAGLVPKSVEFMTDRNAKPVSCPLVFLGQENPEPAARPQAADDAVAKLQYDKETYNVSIGKIQKNDEGKITVELIGRSEKDGSGINRVFIISSNGSGGLKMKYMFDMKISVDGILYANAGSTITNEYTLFVFDTAAMPDRIIVATSWGLNSPNAVFDAKTGKVIKN